LVAASLDNQAALLYAALVLCALAIGCSSFLFLLRVPAVYANQKSSHWFFSIFWLACFACGTFLFVEISPSNIPGTNRFQDAGAKPISMISVYALVIFDTGVFLAISYKLAQTFVPGVQNRVVDSGRGGEDGNAGATKTATTTARWAWWSTAISGKDLPRLSRAILQGGQQYYLLSHSPLASLFANTVL
jgi:hypothetical protein